MGFFNKQKKLVFVINFIIAVFLLSFIFAFKKPYILCNDQWFQYNVFYKEWIRLIIDFIKGRGLPLYSWNSYLGTDFYSSMGYYCTGDIFLPILLIFRNRIEIGLIIEEILCVNISAILMNDFLEKFGVKKEEIRIFTSVVYSITGEASLMYGIYMYHRFFSFLPLLFIGLLDFFRTNKISILIVASAILFLQNYYFMFPTLIVFAIFALTIEIKNKKKIKRILNDGFLVLSGILLGALISAVVTLPSIIYLLSNSRVGNNENLAFLWDKKVYFGLYMSLLSFNPVDIEGNAFFTWHDQHDYWYNLFVGVILLSGCFDYLLKKEHKEEFFMFLFLILIITIKPLNSIMHGFSNPSLRWLFLFFFLILSYGAKGVEQMEENRAIFFIAVCFAISVVLLIVGFVNLDISFKDNRIHLYYILLSLIIGFLIILIYKYKKSLAIVLSILEMVSFQTIFFYLQSKDSYIAEDTISRYDVEYIMQNDEDDTFRFYLNYLNNNPNNSLNLNKSLDYRMMSTSTYNSMTDYKISKFNELANCYNNVEWELTSSDPYANTMLGVKYYIVYKENELPPELNYEYSGKISYLDLYKNLDYKSFGYTGERVKYTKDFVSMKDFIDFILVDDENIDISEFKNSKYSKLNIINKNNNELVADILVQDKSILLIPIPNNKGWKVLLNGKTIEPISVNGGLMGLILEEGYSKIEMRFISPGFYTGIVLSFLGVISLLYFLNREKRKTP